MMKLVKRFLTLEKDDQFIFFLLLTTIVNGCVATVKLILGFMLAGIIGLERSSWSKPAGFRTHALVGSL